MPTKASTEMANIVEKAWFAHHSWPNTLNFDRGTEFMGEFARIAKLEYGLKRKPITTRNPLVNTTIECTHQTTGNIACAFEVNESSDADPWSGMLAATSFPCMQPAIQAHNLHLWLGPFQIVSINNNGTVQHEKGTITDSINMQQIHPHRQPTAV